MHCPGQEKQLSAVAKGQTFSSRWEGPATREIERESSKAKGQASKGRQLCLSLHLMDIHSTDCEGSREWSQKDTWVVVVEAHSCHCKQFTDAATEVAHTWDDTTI